MSKARDLADGTFDTDTLVVDAANNRVGVGTASPISILETYSTSSAGILSTTTTGYSGLRARSTSGNFYSFIDDSTGSAFGTGAYSRVFWSDGAYPIVFGTNSTERARIDSSGNLLVGKTATGVSNYGFAARDDTGGSIEVARDGDTPVFLNRGTSDGNIIDIRKDNSAVGSIGTSNGGLYIGDGDTGLKFDGGADDIRPWNTSTNAARDNAIDLGDSSARFDDIYATNGTIQTSDQNEKQDIEELSEAEKRVATAAKGLIRKFRWIDAVAEKGDDARIHVGVIAQELQAAFEAEGLDAGRYAMFISSTWWEADEIIPAVAEELDEDGNVITEAQPERTVKRTYETAEEAPEGAVERTRLGVRYPELLAFIIGAL